MIRVNTLWLGQLLTYLRPYRSALRMTKGGLGAKRTPLLPPCSLPCHAQGREIKVACLPPSTHWPERIEARVSDRYSKKLLKWPLACEPLSHRGIWLGGCYCRLGERRNSRRAGSCWIERSMGLPGSGQAHTWILSKLIIQHFRLLKYPIFWGPRNPGLP